MLTNITVGTSAFAAAATWFVGIHVHALNSYLMQLHQKVGVFGALVTLGYILPALIFAAIAQMYKLHDRISDWLSIRKRFDLHAILLPMADKLGIAVDAQKRGRIEAKRDDLMRSCFYKYASSTDGREKIDRHLILMALKQWQWYWVLVEGAVVAALACLILLGVRQFAAAACMLGVIVLMLVLLLGLRVDCVRYADQEIKAILDDRERAGEINERLRAI
jgi:hypothetical protein